MTIFPELKHELLAAARREVPAPAGHSSSTQTIPVIDNVYAFTTTQPARISYTDAHGTTHTLPGAIDPRPR
jgi:hypothetical protein